MSSSLPSGLRLPLLGSLFVAFLGVLIWQPPRPLEPLVSILGLTKSAVVIDSNHGITYPGVKKNGIEHYYNIFYAQDTSGSNRFAPPLRFRPTPGSKIDATAPGAVCPQGMGDAALPFTSPVTNVSENCLSLRVARPAGLKPDAKLPVMVYIHGGGNALGTATDRLYEPDGLVRLAKSIGQPVVFVAMNYRLGIFGYATNKALRDSKSANVGLRDQRAAFEWIRENIAVFGGDPGKVTAVGQSVGASSIGLHLTSYHGKQGVPFDQAILMSGASGLNFNIMSDLVANNSATVANTLGCTADFDSQETVNCLRKIPMKDLMEVSVALARKLRPPFGELSFYPSYDGDYIPDRPSVSLRNGKFVKDIPLIASWMTNDGAWYPPPNTVDDASVLASFSTFVVGLSEKSKQRFLAAYPLSDFERFVQPDGQMTAQYYRAAQINRDLWFTCPVLDFTWQYARQGQADVRLYEMNQTRYGPVFEYMGVPHWGVAHLSDIPYVLNGEVAAGGDNSAAQRSLAALLSGSLATFANSGDPTSSGADTFRDWPAAYGDVGKWDRSKMYPQKMSVQVVGGPHGSGIATVKKGAKKGGSEREQALFQEKLFERCELINSIHEEIGV